MVSHWRQQWQLREMCAINYRSALTGKFTKAKHFGRESGGANTEGIRDVDMYSVEDAKPGVGNWPNPPNSSLNSMHRDETGDEHVCAWELW